MKRPLSSGLEGSVERAKRFVSDNLGQEITAIRVASEVRASNCFVFLRLFEETEGERFADFVKRTRVEKARGLVLNPNYTEAEIASAVGFNNVTTFRRAFKKFHGESPTAYRKRIPRVLQRTD
ncbi:MAG: AraC family transcriptional regulator [bacterium]|nr:AraC family transcriptional regulator [bacterium]